MAAGSYVVVGLGVAAAQMASEGGLRRRGDRAAALATLGSVFDDTDNDEGVAVALVGHAA